MRPDIKFASPLCEGLGTRVLSSPARHLVSRPETPRHLHISRRTIPKTFGHSHCSTLFRFVPPKNLFLHIAAGRFTPKNVEFWPPSGILPYMRWILGLLLTFYSVAWAQPTPHTKATLHLSDAAAKPGSTITAALHLKMDEGWHTYWKNPGDSGKATKITWDLPPGITAGEIQWPVPEKVELEGLFTYAFHNEAALLIPLTIAPDAPAGTITIKGKATWLECQKSCVIGSGKLEATLTIGPESKPSPDADKIKQWQEKIPRPAKD